MILFIQVYHNEWEKKNMTNLPKYSDKIRSHISIKTQDWTGDLWIFILNDFKAELHWQMNSSLDITTAISLDLKSSQQGFVNSTVSLELSSIVD